MPCRQKRAEEKNGGHDLCNVPGTNATRTEAAASIVRERPDYSSPRAGAAACAKSLYAGSGESRSDTRSDKWMTRPRRQKWTSEGKNPVQPKLQARPATNDTAAAPSAAMETPTSARPAEADVSLRNRQSRRQSPQDRNLRHRFSPREQMELFEEKLLSKEHIRSSTASSASSLTPTGWWNLTRSLYIIDQHAAHEKVLFEKTFAVLKVQGIYLPDHQPAALS